MTETDFKKKKKNSILLQTPSVSYTQCNKHTERHAGGQLFLTILAHLNSIEVIRFSKLLFLFRVAGRWSLSCRIEFFPAPFLFFTYILRQQVGEVNVEAWTELPHSSEHSPFWHAFEQDTEALPAALQIAICSDLPEEMLHIRWVMLLYQWYNTNFLNFIIFAFCSNVAWPDLALQHALNTANTGISLDFWPRWMLQASSFD